MSIEQALISQSIVVFHFDSIPYQKPKNKKNCNCEMSEADFLIISITGDGNINIMEKLANLSHICLSCCAGWALYQTDYATCPYLYCSFATMFCHGMLGIIRNYSTWASRKVYNNFRLLATTVPIAMLNAHMLYSSGSSRQHIVTIFGATALPFILEIIFPERNERILDVIVLSNVCSLGFKAVDRDFRLGIITSFWQAFYYLLTKNAAAWLQINREIPFNFGLSGMCILSLFTMKQIHLT